MQYPRTKMKIQLLSILTNILAALLNYRTTEAYDDRDFLRGWKDAKVARRRSLNITDQEVVDNETNVTPSIMGGKEVNPRRKYKVR